MPGWRSVAHVMTTAPHVKMRLIALLSLIGSPLIHAEETPDAEAILKTVRIAQSAQNRTLTGQLRTGAKKIPFTLKMDGSAIRWDFTDPPQALVLRLGEKDSTLEEVGASGPRKVAGARFDDKVRDSDVSYEDLAMRFLYWPNPEVDGEQTMLLTRCWIIRVHPPSANASQYGKVKLWISKVDGALLQAEAFNREDKLARRFKVLSGQKTEDGLWMLKQMRIEATGGGRSSDLTPTYLEIERPKS